MALKVYKLKSGIFAQFVEGKQPDGAILADKAKSKENADKAVDVLAKAKAEVKNKAAKTKNK